MKAKTPGALLVNLRYIPGCIPCKPHARGTPVASQVYAKVEGWRTDEVQRSKEPCAETCFLLRPCARAPKLIV